MQTHPLIKDLELLFRYSGMIDQLRDTSRVLHDSGTVTRSTLVEMANQYHQLRQALQSTLDGGVAAELAHWAPELQPETVSVDGIYFAAAALARYIDLVHQTPKFLVAEELAGAATMEMSVKAKAVMENAENTPKVPQSGTYL